MKKSRHSDLGNNSSVIARVLTTRAETRAFYDKISRFYDLLADQSEGPIREAALQMLDAQPGETILEIGVGTGTSLAALYRNVGPDGKAIGLDLSMGMLAQTRLKFAAEGLQARPVLICADATHPPLQDCSVDAILMTFTLELFDTAEIPVV